MGVEPLVDGVLLGYFDAEGCCGVEGVEDPGDVERALSGELALDAGFAFDLVGIDGWWAVGYLGDGDGGVIEEGEAGFGFGSAHDVEEVCCDLDVGSAGVGYFLEGGA